MTITRDDSAWRSDLVCRTGSDLSDLDEGLLSDAQRLVAESSWPMFDDLVSVCVDEALGEVLGVASTNHDGDILFVVVEDRRNEGIGTFLAESLLSEIEDATEEAVLAGEWDPPYHAVAGSEDGAKLLSSLPSKLGWKAFALIDWSGYAFELEEWRQQNRQEGVAQVPLPLPARVTEPLRNDDRHLDVRIYAWPDGSDAVLSFDILGRELELKMRWIWSGRPLPVVDRAWGKNEDGTYTVKDPVFAIDLGRPNDPNQIIQYEPEQEHLPEALVRKLRGLFIDMGAEHPTSRSPGLVSARSDLGPFIRYPWWATDAEWENRYATALERIDNEGRWIGPFENLSLHKYTVKNNDRAPLVQWAETPNTATTIDVWEARWSLASMRSASTLERLVDELLTEAMVYPKGIQESWEKANLDRGTFVLPTADEISVFAALGERLPWWWSFDAALQWARERT